MRRLLILGLLLWSARDVSAQAPFVQMVSKGGQDTLSSNGDEMIIELAGMASARIQTLDSYSGTWEVQCSTDLGVTYDTDDELNLVLDGQSATAQAVTDTVGIWAANVAGCTHIKIIATAGFAATDTVVRVTAVSSGGGAGGGGAGTSDATLAEQQAQTTLLNDITPAYGENAAEWATVRITNGTSYPNLASDLTIGSPYGTTAPGVVYSYKEFDGAALPTTTNVNTEEEAVPPAATLQGVAYMFLVNEDGSKQLGKLEDDPAATADYAMPVLTRRRDTASGSGGTENDYQTLDTDSLGRLWVRRGDPCADHARLQSVAIDTAASGNVELVALNGSDIVYVCGYDLVADAAVAVQFIYGTGSACGTGETDLSGPMSFAANGGMSVPNTGSAQFKNIAGNALCIENSTTGGVRGMLKYVRTATP
jgi:hypothetical protein